MSSFDLWRNSNDARVDYVESRAKAADIVRCRRLNALFHAHPLPVNGYGDRRALQAHRPFYKPKRLACASASTVVAQLLHVAGLLGPEQREFEVRSGALRCRRDQREADLLARPPVGPVDGRFAVVMPTNSAERLNGTLTFGSWRANRMHDARVRGPRRRLRRRDRGRRSLAQGALRRTHAAHPAERALARQRAAALMKALYCEWCRLQDSNL